MEALQVPEARAEAALARAALYRLAAHAFLHPGEGWHAEWRSQAGGAREAARACRELGGTAPALEEALERSLQCPLSPAEIVAEHARVVGHTPRAATTPYETEWSSAAGELLQFHLISDIAAFYRAFCLQLGPASDERPDHVSVELEFLQYLSVKEAWAEEHHVTDLADLCRETACKFLSEHLGTWVPAFCHRVVLASPDGYYGRSAAFLRELVQDDCRRLGAVEGDPSRMPGETTYRTEEACMSCSEAIRCGAGFEKAPGSVPAGRDDPHADD